MALEDLLRTLREYPGLRRKAVVGEWASRFLAPAMAEGMVGVGADAGAVEVPGGYVLLSAEGLNPVMAGDPRFAGLCAVAVAVNDIYASGGRPVGIAIVVYAGAMTPAARGYFLEGLADGLDHYRVPLLGGHTNPEGGMPVICVTAAGFAGTLFRSAWAAPGHALLFVTDLEGRAHPDFFAWDTLTGRDGGRTLEMLDVLPLLAEGGVRACCRDVSNPGLLGTLAMMLEQCGLGAEVDLDAVPVPPGVGLEWWLEAHPSFGFLLATGRGSVDEVSSAFNGAGACCRAIGELTEDTRIYVNQSGYRAVFVDIRGGPVTGLAPPRSGITR